jgi:quercetin dioxygenase-like cupin family protein
MNEWATSPDDGPAWWFLGTLAVLRNPAGAPRTPVVVELTLPAGASPPLHEHANLDDAYYLLEGTLAAQCGEHVRYVRAGDYVSQPHGVPHTFRVVGGVQARMLQIHADDSFLRMIEELGEPTNDRTLPTAPPQVDAETVLQAHLDNDVILLGESLSEERALSIVAG